MPRSLTAKRVLVVDDLRLMRDVIGRTLSAHGYLVETAGTLAEAGQLKPAGYDAILIDANLGDERGVDLYRVILADDPAAAARCLLMTGGNPGALPDGLGCLAKPFQAEDLLAAVGALSGTDDGDGGTAAPVAAGPRPIPESVMVGSASAAARRLARPAGSECPLLGFTRDVRARDREDISDFLHDGPIQNLTAAILRLQSLRDTVPDDRGEAFDAVREQLTTAARALRWLTATRLPLPDTGARLTEELQRRMSWLVTGEITVDAGEFPAPSSGETIPVITDVTELVLAAMSPEGPVEGAHVRVGDRRGATLIEVCVPGAGQAQAGLARQAVSTLATTLGGTAWTDFGAEGWRAEITVPGAPAA